MMRILRNMCHFLMILKKNIHDGNIINIILSNLSSDSSGINKVCDENTEIRI